MQSDSQTSEWYSYFENDVLGQMLVDDGYKRGKNEGKIQGALLCGKTPEEVAEMLKISVREVLKVQEEENLKSIKKL